MRINNRIMQSGRSLVEMMGYMAVVIAVVAAVGNIVNHAYEEFKYSKASLQVGELAGAIVKMSAVDVNYNDIIEQISGDGSTTESIRKIVPKSFRVSGKNIYHAFGGKVTVATVTDGKFSIKFENLNRKQCIELAMKEWQNNRTVDLYELYVNTHVWYWDAYGTSGTNADALPVKRSKVAGTDTASGQCLDGRNSIMWIFN